MFTGQWSCSKTVITAVNHDYLMNNIAGMAHSMQCSRWQVNVSKIQHHQDSNLMTIMSGCDFYQHLNEKRMKKIMLCFHLSYNANRMNWGNGTINIVTREPHKRLLTMQCENP